MLATGAFSPLRGFLGPADYDSVVETMRLDDGTLWPIPVMLDVEGSTAGQLEPGVNVALRDEEGVMLAALRVEDVWQPDLHREALQVYGTDDTSHPGVSQLLGRDDAWYISGPIEVLTLPRRYDFRSLRLTPAQVRVRLAARGWSSVVAFQTRNPIHRAHLEITMRAARDAAAGLLIHPVVGMTKPGDIDHYTRVRSYRAVLGRYPDGAVELALAPLAMRMAGPREALWHAIIRRNYGCSHLIVGRDHAGPGTDAQGKAFYGPYDAQALVAEHSAEIGVVMVPFKMMAYDPERDAYVTEDEVAPGSPTLTVSGTELRDHLASGRDLPTWFTFPEVEEELRRSQPPRRSQGFTVLFTGLSGSGKSTVANVLRIKLLEAGGRHVTLLDGDLVRRNLSSELGFSKEHRNLNVYRIGYVASEITKNGGIAICAPIAPYADVRAQVRELVSPNGGFALVHISTPLEICELRDTKGLYAKARAGLIAEFTGISDPYEPPTDAEVTIDTTDISPEEAAEFIVGHLRAEGYVEAPGA
jgi:sulfate adenylyltransferase